MTATLTPLYYCESLPHLGGFSRLRIAYSNDVVQQQFQSDTELERIVFLKFEKWIGDFSHKDHFLGELKIDAATADFGVDEKFSFKTTHEVDKDPKQFRQWYTKHVRHRRFVLEITNNNGFVRILNPFFCTYNYLGTADFSGTNRYELTFVRTKLVDNLIDLSNNTITSIDVTCNAPEQATPPPTTTPPEPTLIFISKTEYK